LVAKVEHHPLVAALQLAYSDHRPLSLSPDMIWLLICQGVAHHIDANAEELRPRLVRHPGRLTLEAEISEPGRFIKGSPDNPWPEVLARFSEQIARHVGPFHDSILPSFSTTGPVERAAAEIVLLDSMKRYFHYLLTTLVCGIPAITLEGTAADWQAIADRAEAFAQLDLEWWIRPLRPILRRIAASAAGEVDAAFWRSIYRVHKPSGACLDPDTGLGWIGLFFPYLTDGDGSPTRRNPWLTGERNLDELIEPQAASRAAGGTRTTFLYGSDLPSGMAVAPFTWDERKPSGEPLARWPMEFLGGFIGVTQDPETLALRPEIGWAVREGTPGSRS
jgi:hypothetical protein